MKFVHFTKRTNDPKLSHLELLLKLHGISSRRAGYSFHAPILTVPESQLAHAETLLASDVFGDGRSYDDIPDDDDAFIEFDQEEDDEDDDPRSMGWVGSDGLP